MKRIMLIIFSVIMLFSACGNQTKNITDTTTESYIETSAPKTQIDPAEEFGGITFGMTQDEVISIVGKKPYKTYGPNDIDSDYNYVMYRNEEHFNAVAAYITYCFTRTDGTLHRVLYEFHRDESEQDQSINSYEAIKEEIIKHYPEEICTYFLNGETDLTIYTENRSVFLHAGDSLIRIFVDEYLPGIYDTRSDIEDEHESAEESIQTQINPAEEFGGITFGMTQDEIIEFHGKQPDYTFENGDITYENETYFNINNADVDYCFDGNEKLYTIRICYRYSDDSEDSSFQADYDSIKEELLKRYSESTSYVNDYASEFVTSFTLVTDDRFITLSRSDMGWDHTINVSIDKR